MCTDLAPPLLECGHEHREVQAAAICKQGSIAAQRKDGKVSQTQTKETLPGYRISRYFKAKLAIAKHILSRSVLTSTKVQKEIPNCFIHMLPGILSSSHNPDRTACGIPPSSCGWRPTSSILECLRHKAPLTTLRNEDQTKPQSKQLLLLPRSPTNRNSAHGGAVLTGIPTFWLSTKPSHALTWRVPHCYIQHSVDVERHFAFAKLQSSLNG